MINKLEWKSKFKKGTKVRVLIPHHKRFRGWLTMGIYPSNYVVIKSYLYYNMSYEVIDGDKQYEIAEDSLEKLVTR